MIIGKDHTNGEIEVEDIKIKNKKHMKILGTIYNENVNVNLGTNSLYVQLKRRSNAIIRIAKPFGIELKKTHPFTSYRGTKVQHPNMGQFIFAYPIFFKPNYM